MGIEKTYVWNKAFLLGQTYLLKIQTHCLCLKNDQRQLTGIASNGDFFSY